MTHQQAYRAVRTAIKQGVLVRPEECARCGNRPSPAADGRARIHAHHHDYGRPLDVEWICAKCHREETPLPEKPGAPCYGDRNGMRRHPEIMQGSKNGWSKLNEEQVAEIRILLKRLSVKDIAAKFNVRPTTIYDIRLGRRWKHVAAAPKP
jgi:hypothetical protein